jgi:hypothetical protein
MNQIKVLALEEINFPRKKFCNYENVRKIPQNAKKPANNF